MENWLQRSATNGSTNLNQLVFDTARRQNPTVSVNVDMEIDSMNSVNLNATLISYYFQNNIFQDNQFQLFHAKRNYSRNIYQTAQNIYPTVSLSYSKRFKKAGDEWSMLAYYNKRSVGQQYHLFQTEQNLVNYEEDYQAESANKELSFQTDYMHASGKKVKWVTGVKVLLRNYKSEYDLVPYDVSRHGDFDYQQDIYAAYLSFETVIGKWQLRTGVRYEQTELTAVFNTSKVNIEPYKNVVPNFIMSRNFKNNNTFSVSYSQRISRPSNYSLNPKVNYSDSLNITSGNPALKPQVTHRVETSYTFKGKGASFLRISVFGSKSNNSFAQIRKLGSNGIAQIRSENLGIDNTIGFTASWSQEITKQLKSVLNLNTSWQQFRVPELGLSNSGCWLFASLYLVYNFKNGYTLDGFIMSQTPQLELQGKNIFAFPHYYFLSASKKLWKDKMGISITMDSFLTPTQAFIGKYEDPDFVQKNTWYNSNRIFQLRITWRFNQKLVETKTRAGSKAQAVQVE